MKKWLLGLMMSMICFVAACALGAALGGGGVGQLELKDVDSGLGSTYSADPRLNAFYKDSKGVVAHPECQVKWAMVCGPTESCAPEVSAYDEKFKKAAIMAGTVKQIKFTLDEIGAGKLTLNDAIPVTDFARKNLSTMKDQASQLLGEIQKLNPVQDLKKYPLKVTPATTGLKDAIKNLQMVITETPNLLISLNKVVAAPQQ